MSAFDPASLFHNDEAGAWYDPSDLSTLWQDTGGTVAVTEDGQSVARIDDKSGNGNHATQSTASKRPVYKTDGTLHWLLFDGTDDVLEVPAAASGAVSSGNTAVVGLTLTASPDYNPGILAGDSTKSIGLYAALGAGHTIRPLVDLTGGTVAANGTTPIPSTPSVCTLIFDRAGTTLKGRFDGSEEASTSTSDTDKTSAATYSLGAAGAAYWPGACYGVVLTDDLLTSAELTNAEDWVAEKQGRVL